MPKFPLTLAVRGTKKWKKDEGQKENLGYDVKILYVTIKT